MTKRPSEPDRAPVAYAGEPGAFAEDAVLAVFGDVERRAVGSFREVFEAVEAGHCGAGVLPIENVLGGTVREVYDLLLDHGLEIVGEVVVPVRLCLAALPGQSLDGIARVYSHIQAIGQAEVFLRTRPWTILTTYNTAGAGRLIRESGELGAAAVLSPRAAALFDLEIVATDVQGIPDNRTRFLVVAPPEGQSGLRVTSPREREAARGAGARRTTLAFAVANRPGTLLAALRAFADRGLNLSKLESRPGRTTAWAYVFWVDLEADASAPATAAAIDELRSVATMVRILGSYPRGSDPSPAAEPLPASEPPS